MRVGVIGSQNEDDFAYNIGDGLRDLDIEPVLLGSTRAPIGGHSAISKSFRNIADLSSRLPKVDRTIAKRLASGVAEADLDLVITVESLSPGTVQEIRDQGVPISLWFPDAISNLGPLWMFSAPYSAVFMKEPFLVERVRALVDMPIFYLPEAANPNLHRIPTDDVTGRREDDPYVAVVGNFYPTRIRLLERLHSDGFPLRLFGSPLPSDGRAQSLASLHTGKYVRGAEKAHVFREASAVLNNLHPAEVHGVNCRLFEAAACGGAVVTEHRQVLPDLFELNVEVLPFRSYEELCEQLTRAITSPELSRGIGDASAARAATDHTYAVRLLELVERSMS